MPATMHGDDGRLMFGERGDRPAALNLHWRQGKYRLFSVPENSTGGGFTALDLWGVRRRVYCNANLSIYSAQRCNARCPFCVEELRPASRGTSLDLQKRREPDDERYFGRLQDVLDALRPLNPSVSITGGEPSLDQRLPRILRVLERAGARKRTLTTNGSGLLRSMEGLRAIDWIVRAGVSHLNLSVAHPDPIRNAHLMVLPEALSIDDMREIARLCRAGGVRVRLSCVLLKDGIDGVSGILDYLLFAQSLGIDNVIFRQLMRIDLEMVMHNTVTRYCAQNGVELAGVLERLGERSDFEFVRQILGYYYYVEVWRWQAIQVVFEEADLARLEHVKSTHPDEIHELIFHPGGDLASTWQPWDGVLGPPRSGLLTPEIVVASDDLRRQ